MEANKEFEAGQTLTYAEFSNQFVYKLEEREWYLRKREYFIGYIWSLLYENFVIIQKYCTTYESIMIVNGITYPSFQDIFYFMGLLLDDRKFIAAINKVWSSIEKTVCDAIDI